MADDASALFRLFALEILMMGTLVSRYLATPDPISAAKAHRQHMRQIFSEVSAPFLNDPALSELAIGEVGDAIDRLLENTAQTVARRVGEQQRP